MRTHLIRLVALLSFSVCTLQAAGAQPDVGAQIVATAESQLHVRELTGKNDGAQVQAYLKVVGLRGNWPWCGAFVAWVFRQVGLPIPAGAGGARYWFPKNRIIWQQGHGQTPQPGHVVGYRWGRKDQEDHVGILKIWGSTPLAATLEGNTSGGRLNRDGQGVFLNWRHKSQIYRVANWNP